MRTSRDRRGSTQVDLYPEEQECPVCQHALKERYHKQRWIIRLDQHVKVVSHFLECGMRLVHGKQYSTVRSRKMHWPCVAIPLDWMWWHV